MSGIAKHEGEEPIIERVAEYPGYLARFRPARAGAGAVLLLHGFPGNRNLKNLDLAIHLLLHTDRTIYLLHYRGLGESPGSFRFTDSIREAIDVVDFLSSHSPLSLVGHSWGGLVAVNAVKSRPEKIASAVLLSPFLDAKLGDPLEEWITQRVRTECPQVFGEFSEAEIRADYETILEAHLPSKLVASLPAGPRIGVIQAKLDDTTPASVARALVPRFPQRPQYVELDRDHSFTGGRQELARHVVSMLRTL